MTKTGKLRLKRPDGRSLSKKRKTLLRHKMDKESSIQDLRVTRVQKGQRKERSIDIAAMPLRDSPGSSAGPKNKDEKLLRALKKKLRSMEPLLAKQASGELLSETQLQKLESLDDVLADLADVTETIEATSQRGAPLQTKGKGKNKKAYPVVEETKERGYFNEEDEESDSDEE